MERVTVFDGLKEEEDFPDDLDSLIAWLTEMRDKIPPEHRKTARFRLVGAGVGMTDIEISYRR
ncbi:hypothetical protein BH10PSE6_BH10PSE6_16800 [soil metagenome]